MPPYANRCPICGLQRKKIDGRFPPHGPMLSKKNPIEPYITAYDAGGPPCPTSGRTIAELPAVLRAEAEHWRSMGVPKLAKVADAYEARAARLEADLESKERQDSWRPPQ